MAVPAYYSSLKLRYPAGKLASRVSKARRYAHAALFDRQIRKLDQLMG